MPCFNSFAVIIRDSRPHRVWGWVGLSIKMSSNQYRYSHFKDKMVSPSYLYNGYPILGKWSLYWDKALRCPTMQLTTVLITKVSFAVHKNIAQYAAYLVVSSPNSTHWISVYTSDLVMVIKWNTNVLSTSRDPLYKHGLTLIPAWLSNHMPM